MFGAGEPRDLIAKWLVPIMGTVITLWLMLQSIASHCFTAAPTGNEVFLDTGHISPAGLMKLVLIRVGSGSVGLVVAVTVLLVAQMYLLKSSEV